MLSPWKHTNVKKIFFSLHICPLAVVMQLCCYYIIIPTVISYYFMNRTLQNALSNLIRMMHLDRKFQDIHRLRSGWCFHVVSFFLLPCGKVMQAPSTIACASSRSLHSTAKAAARSASQISFRPSNAGAVSQNSSLLLLSWPSVIGYSLFHFGRSFFRGSLRTAKYEWGQFD